MAQQGLGLTNALGLYQQGRQWRQQQDQVEQQNKRRDDINAASKAGAEVMARAQQEHEAQQAAALLEWSKTKGSADGFQAMPFKADEGLFIKALDARSGALASRGRWDDWMENEAKAMPLRERVRETTIGKALQQYDSDSDPVALARAVYPTIYDGKDIADVQVDKTGGLGFKGASGMAVAGKDMPSERYVFKLSDGTALKPMTREQLVERVKWAQMNPTEVRKYELQQRMTAAKQAAELETLKQREAARGSENRETEKVKHGYRLAEIGLQNQGRQDVAETRAETSIAVANKRGAGGGGGGGKGSNVQSVQTDNDGFKIIVFRNGETKRLSIDGKPVRGEAWSKRVDKLAGDLGKSLDGFKKSPEELRAQAETMLIGKAVPDGEPEAATPKPAGKTGVKFLGFEQQ
jgi:hypothetical protein